uniref:Uncharacterized protein n=1 Tax=Ditylenchus dipsaci TaxID=166011 RepID=A0A915DEI7_9BILA
MNSFFVTLLAILAFTIASDSLDKDVANSINALGECVKDHCPNSRRKYPIDPASSDITPLQVFELSACFRAYCNEQRLGLCRIGCDLACGVGCSAVCQLPAAREIVQTAKMSAPRKAVAGSATKFATEVALPK